MVLKGKLMVFGQKNANGHIYPIELRDDIIGALSNRLDDSCGIMGELSHGSDSKPTISLSRVSHVVENVEMPDDEPYIGVELRTLPTSDGALVDAMSNSGIPLYAVPRILATIDDVGDIVSCDLVTVDISTSSAFGEDCRLARVDDGDQNS